MATAVSSPVSDRPENRTGFVLLTPDDGIPAGRIRERERAFDKLHELCGTFAHTDGWNTCSESAAATVLEIIECCRVLTTPLVPDDDETEAQGDLYDVVSINDQGEMETMKEAVVLDRAQTFAWSFNLQPRDEGMVLWAFVRPAARAEGGAV